MPICPQKIPRLRAGEPLNHNKQGAVRLTRRTAPLLILL